MQATTKSNSVDDYIKGFPADVQKRINQIRQAVKKNASAAVEGISYGMVGYKLNSKPLVYIGGFKNHVGLFPTGQGIATLKKEKEFDKYITSKGTMQFKHSEPIPMELVTKVIKLRLKEIA